MSDKNETQKPDEIGELLGDYKKQKEEREKNFGKIKFHMPKQSADMQSGADAAPPEANAKKERHKAGENSQNTDRETGAERKHSGGKARSAAHAVKAFFKTKKGKKIMITAAAVLCAAAVAAGGFALIRYEKTAYLRPYIEKYPDVDFPAGIRENYCEQYARVPATTGYLSIEACSYGSFVVQSTASAQPALSFSNRADGLDFNTVIRMPDGACDLESVFGSAESYLAASQKITYSTLFEDYDFTVIGAFYTNTDPDEDGGYVFPYDVTQKMTPISFNDYTDRLYHRFLYETEYKLRYDTDQILTVVTDSQRMPGFEFVVVCALGAPAQSSATPNDSVHYPQAWYDARGEINPYRFSDPWYPTVYIDDSEEETSIQSEEDYQ